MLINAYGVYKGLSCVLHRGLIIINYIFLVFEEIMALNFFPLTFFITPLSSLVIINLILSHKNIINKNNNICDKPSFNS